MKSEFLGYFEPCPIGKGWKTAIWTEEVVHFYAPKHLGLMVVEFPFVDGAFVCTPGHTDTVTGTTTVVSGPYATPLAAAAALRLIS